MYQFLTVKKVHGRGNNGVWFVSSGVKGPDDQMWFHPSRNGLKYYVTVFSPGV